MIIEVSSLLSEVVLYTKATFGTPESVLIIEVSLFQRALIRKVPLYNSLVEPRTSDLAKALY